MGKRGPKPTPKPVLAMRGSRLVAARDEIAHADGECSCPDWLGDVGREKWGQLYPQLAAVPGLMKPVYADALALYCEAFEEFIEARTAIISGGAVSMSEKGAEYQHPEVGRKNKAIQRMRQFGGMFGLSPADATRVNPGDSGSAHIADPLAALLQPGTN